MDPVSRAQNCLSTAQPKKTIGRPFEKGAAWKGNAGGRPKRLHFSKLCEGILKSREGKEMLREVMTDILKKRGMAAVLLMREMAERTEGKVTQPVEHSGEIGIADTITDARKRAGLEVIDITSGTEAA